MNPTQEGTVAPSQRDDAPRFIRVSAVSSPVVVANPHRNRLAIEACIQSLGSSDVIVFGELCLSGYTCGELFKQQLLLDACRKELVRLAVSCRAGAIVFVGIPWAHQGKLYNCAAALSDGKVLGIVPKQHLPNYREFYDARWFHSGAGVRETISIPELGYTVPFGDDLLFQSGSLTIGVEICEDLWVPIPPSSQQCIAGANLLVNLSASNETVGKSTYRRSLVANQSGRCNAAYAYASAGPSESTTDLVFGGHCLIAETGTILAESKRVGSGLPLLRNPATLKAESDEFHATVDVDIDRIEHDRRSMGTMHQTNSLAHSYRTIPFKTEDGQRDLVRWIDPHPFVPKDTATLHERCDEVFEIQIAGLAKRVSELPEKLPLVIGVSGGLDSTLATLVTASMLSRLSLRPDRLIGLTMPGFGTSQKTKSNALALIDLLGLKSESIDIRPSCMQIFQNLNHRPFGISCVGKTPDAFQAELEQLPDAQRHDLVFENVQARMRTLLLMSRGFVVGTGDLSESALGWCTYNADHMSMYNVNCSVPKTLVRFLVQHAARNFYDGEIRRVLLAISDTPISPELLPLSENKTIHQSTEASVGPYELHDFFLYHFVRTGASPEKILYLAKHAKFDGDFSHETISHWLGLFMKRFFAAQFKRSCVPDGPKIGSVSLSPRGDWRMPSDASGDLWSL